MFTYFTFTIFATLMLALSALGVPTPGANTTSVVDLKANPKHSGRGAWYNVGHGNCGNWNANSDAVVAISKALYDANDGGHCDQYVQITNKANGKTTYAMTRDSCVSCGYYDLDMSPSTFEKLASLDKGVIQISWHFKNKDWHP